LGELRELSEAGYKAIFFDDATFTVNQKHTIALMGEIQTGHLNLEFAAQTRSECVSEALIKEMARAGFVYLSFGLETTDEWALSNIMKSKRPEDHLRTAAKAVEMCKEFGIQTCLNLIVGLPNESEASLLKTFEFVNKVDPTYVSLSALALYPHQQADVAQRYHDGVSLEPVWNNFDEGYGAVHPYIDAERAQEVLQIAHSVLGTRLDLV